MIALDPSTSTALRKLVDAGDAGCVIGHSITRKEARDLQAAGLAVIRPGCLTAHATAAGRAFADRVSS